MSMSFFRRESFRRTGHLRVLGIALIIMLGVCIGIACVGAQRQLSSENLDEHQKQLAAELKGPTRTYLVEKMGLTGFGGKPFCAFKVLDVEAKDVNVDEYLYALCQEYYPSGGELKKGTGAAMPVALHFRKENGNYLVVSYQTPRDGSSYAADVKQFFPEKTQYEILQVGSNHAPWQDEVEREAKAYYQR